MRMRALARSLAAAAGAGAMLVATATVTAHAETARQPSLRGNEIARTSDGYCVYDLDVGAMRCAGTESTARAMVRGKKTIMTAWGKPRWQGKHVNFYSRDSHPCYGPQIFSGVDNLRKVRSGLPGKKNWNNRISSLVMRKGCKVALYARADFEGNHTDWLGTRGRLGRVPDPGDNWNNAATSMYFGGS